MLFAERNKQWIKTMKRIAPQVYSYKGYEIDGYESEQYDWRISLNGEWILSLPLKRDCKEWIDLEG